MGFKDQTLSCGLVAKAGDDVFYAKVSFIVVYVALVKSVSLTWFIGQ